jgi:hypothetical protein
MKIIIYLVLIATLASCKKDNATPVTTTSTTSTTSTNFGGFLNTVITRYNTGNTVANQDSLAYCFFIDNVNYTGTGVYAGNVSYNGTVMQYNSNIYQDTTALLNLHQPNAVWYITGSAQVQGFTYTNTPSYPIYTGYNLLPDSFSISAGVTINLGTSFSNVNDSITISVGSSVLKKIGANQTSCYFSPANLMYVPINNSSTIEIEFNKQSSVNFNSRNYYVNNRLRHTKYGVKIKA